MTETQALQDLLGERGLTDDRLADLLRAEAMIADDDERTTLRNKVLYHGLHAELGSWRAVAARVGKPLKTVWNRAHTYWRPDEEETQT